MARFEVEGRIRARDDASRQVRAVERALAENREEVERLQREFDQGDRSARDFVQAMERLDREADGLQREMRGLGDQTGRTSGRMEGFGGFLRRNFVVTLGDVVGGVRAVGRALGSMIEAAAEAEEAQTRLANATDRAEGASRAMIPSLNAQAEAFERNTRFSQETVTSIQALLLEMEVAPEKIDQATRATVNVAEALGVTLETAARGVAKTTAGLTGEIGEQIPGLARLREEGRLAADGLDFLAEKFEGAAEAAGQDLRVQIQQTREELSDLGQAFIEGLTQSGDFNEALETTQQVLRDAEQPTREFAAGLAEIARNAGAAGDALPDFVRQGARLQGLTGIFRGMVDAVRELGRESIEAEEPLVLVGDRLVRVSDVSIDAAGNIRTFADVARESADSTRAGADAASDQADAMAELSERVRDTARALGLMDEAQDDLTESESAFVRALEEAGISVTNVNAEIERNQEVIDRARAALRTAGRGEVQVYRDAIREAEANIRELREQQAGTNEALDDSAASFRGAARGASAFATETSRVARTAGDAGGGIRSLRTDTESLRGSFDAVVESAGRLAAIQATLAAGGTLTQGGTRVRLPGGGSRLVDAPGFGSASRESRFFSNLTTVV